jgi:putative heme-binding domain-containing protein
MALLSIARRDGADGYVRLAVLSSLAMGAGETLSFLTDDKAFAQSKEGVELLGSLATQIGKQQRGEDVALTLQSLASLSKSNSPALSVIVQRLAAKEGTPLAGQIAAATGGKAEEVMRALVSSAAATAADASTPLAKRVAAVEQLRLAKFADQQELLAALLAPTVPVDLQAAALATLGSFDAPEVAPFMLEPFAAFSPRLKGQATDVLLSRPAWTLSLLTAIEKGQVSTGDLDPVRLKLLADHADEAIRSRAAKLLASMSTSKRADVVAAYQSVLKLPGDAVRGKQVFAKTCAACHKVQGIGNELAPNLAAMKARGSEAILLNVLDPNREVNPQFLSYALLTLDGRQLTGMIAAETATSVTLKRADNATDTVLRIDIDRLKSTGMSLMPEGLEKQIDEQAMADLLEFLKSVE